VSESRCIPRVQDRQAGRRVGEGENLEERSTPRTTNSLKKDHKCHIRNHEGKREQERGGREGWNAGGENMAEICMRLRNWAMRG
jgi:hypothetical protein